ncbi:MAG: DUF1015 family protein [Varibaculum sp.]|nr:DUF1015 family protein [Varibaculum sp.]
MVQIIPFAAWHPTAETAPSFACPPYDVVDREGAKKLAPKHRFLEVIRPEIGLPAGISEDDPQAHELARTRLQDFKDDGTLIHDEEPQLYIYREVKFGHEQTGVVACVRTADYRNGIIKRHERTIVQKEQNRVDHFKATKSQTEPVFLTYEHDQQIDYLVQKVMLHEPLINFTDAHGSVQQLWPVPDYSPLVQSFSQIGALYIADGHHRTASAARVAEDLGLDGDDPNNSIMAVIFPDNQLNVLAYNRIVHGLNGLTPAQLQVQLANDFGVYRAIDARDAKPRSRHTFGMRLGGQWYRIVYHGEDTGNVIGDLDSQILSDRVLKPLLGIEDLRTDPRIEFVGGTRSINIMEERTDNDSVAFGLYPTSVAEMIAVADVDEIMPPKSTWFEPKIDSGLFLKDLG